MRKLLLLCLVFLASTYTFGQLSGIKTIPGNYATLTAAIADLNTVGVGAGGVTFNIAAGYTETFPSPTSGTITATGTVTDPVVFQKSGAGANPIITAGVGTGTTDGIIKIAGGDYITFDMIDLSESAGNVTATTQMEWGYALVKASATAPFNGCQYVVIKNCAVTLNKTNTSSIGIYSGNHIATATTSLTITAPTDAVNNCKIYGNTISNSYGGISMGGFAAASPYTLYDQNNEIGVTSGNTLSNLGGGTVSVRGIYAIYQNGLKISGNNINTIANGATTTVYGIFTSTGTSSNITISNNTITLLFTVGAYTSTFYGINNAMGSTALSNTVAISNNVIQNCNLSTVTTGGFQAIVNSATAATVNIFGNTVSSNTLAGTGDFYGIYNSASMGTNTLNIYQNTITGNNKTGTGGTMYCSRASTATISFYLNEFYLNSIAGGTGTLYGYYNIGSPVSETYYSNAIHDLTHSGTGAVYGMSIITASGIKNSYGNTIATLSSAGGAVYGYSSGYGAPHNFYKNRIYDLTSTTASGLVYGVSLSAPSANIYNNYIAELKAPQATGTNAINGLYISGGTTSNVYYNTVYINATSSSATTFGTTGIYKSSTTTGDFRNNIIVNGSTPGPTGGLTVAHRWSGVYNATYYAAASNNNDFYAGTPDATHLIFYDGTNSDQTMAAYKARVSPCDGNSFAELPPFTNITTSPYNLHLLTTTATQCESGGVTVSSPAIVDDYDGHARYPNAGYPDNPTYPATAPDIGADEFAGRPLDLNPPNISYTALANTSGTGARVLTATITDPSGVPTSGLGLPVLYWKINAGGTWNNVQGVSLGSNQYSFTFGAGVVITDVVYYYIVAQDNATPPNVGSNPSVGASGFTANPPACTTPPTTPSSYSIIGTISGIFPVGVGQTYVTLTAAVADLNAKEMVGPVTFVLYDANYTTPAETFPIIIQPNPGSSATNTLTIKPNTGITPLITGSGNPGLLIFNGSDYITIDGSNAGGTDKSLTIENTYTAGTAGTVMWFYNGSGAVNNTLKNCIIKGGSNSISTIYGVFLNYSGGQFNNTTIQNNTILKAYAGLQFVGVSGGVTNGGLIKDNIFGSTTDAESIGNIGMSLVYSDGVTITNNTIMNLKIGNNPRGILLSTAVVNSTVNANNITGIVYTGTGGYGGKGIDVGTGSSTSNITISNNTISNISGDGYSTWNSDAIVGIRILANTGGVNLYFNSINLTGTCIYNTATVSGCVYISSTSTNLNLKDNIFANSIVNTVNTGGKSYAIFSDAPNTAFISINYNDYYASGTQAVLGYLGGDRISVFAWATATGQDGSSISVNPAFVSTTDLHTAVLDLNNTGIAVAGITTDFAGVTRSNPPDYGAYEFSLVPNVFTVAATGMTATGAVVNGQIVANNEAVTTGFDYGLTTGYGSSVAGVPATISGYTITDMSATLSSLIPNSEYNFRAKGTANGSTVYGVNMTFNTLAIAPTAVTNAATSITGTGAQLNGTVNANNSSTTVTFEYGLTSTYGTTVTATQSPVTGYVNTPVSYALAGLDPNTTYHYRVVAVNGTGTANGLDMTFTTSQVPPVAVTDPASPVGFDNATLNGHVIANNLSTTVTFEYGLTNAYGSTIAATPGTVTGMTNTAVSASLTSLIPATTYHFRVKAVSSAGTTNGLDATFLTGCPMPADAGVISGPANVCKTIGGYIFSVPAIANATGYAWTLPVGFTITGGLNTNSITVSVSNTAVSGNVSVYGTNACGNGNPSSKSVTVNNLPTPTITGSSSVCMNAGSAYTTETGMSNYLWTVNPSVPPSNIIGQGTSAVTIIFPSATTYTVGVNYQTPAGCTAAASTTKTVIVNPLPTPTITGSASVCMNAGSSYTTETGMNSYLWTVTPSVPPANITGQGTSAVTIIFPTAATYTLTVNYQTPAGCTAASATTKTVIVNPLPAPAITGPATVCSASTGNIYTTQTGMTGYIWTISPGGTITAGAGTNAITVTWTGTGAQNITVTYTNANGCSAAAPVTYPVTVNPVPSPTITGTNNLCVNSGYYNYNTEAGQTGYVWTISAGGTITFGQGTNQVQVLWNAAGAQYLTVNYNNTSGCAAVTPTTFNVTVNGLPNAAGNITGTANVCAGAMGIAYSVAPITNAVTYVWNLPVGATIASGSGTNSITVDYSSTAVSGAIIVYGNNLCGNGSASPAFNVNVSQIPAAAGTITGETAICQGTTGVAYTVPVIAYATTYVWTLPAGATVASGAGTNSITVDFADDASSGDIAVYGSNFCGNGTVSAPLAVTLNPVPETPVIAQYGDTLYSNAPSGNQWYFEGNPIAGATGATYVPEVTGVYYSVVTLIGCSSEHSNQVYVIITGIGELKESGISIYPVPNDGRFTVSINDPQQNNYSIVVYNNIGMKVFETKNIAVKGNTQKVVDLRPAPSGVYSVVIQGNDNKVIMKIMVNR